jgi:uncharacterized protein YvpB
MINHEFEIQIRTTHRWALQKNPQQTRNKNKMSGYEGKPFMNHLGFMEIDDHVDFLYLSCFVGLPFS